MNLCARCDQPRHRGLCRGQKTPHNYVAMSFEDIGAAMNISREEAACICRGAILKLRRRGAGEVLAGLTHERELVRKRPTSSLHAARAYVFRQRQA
jgi:hypothetical protein